MNSGGGGRRWRGAPSFGGHTSGNCGDVAVTWHASANVRAADMVPRIARFSVVHWESKGVTKIVCATHFVSDRQNSWIAGPGTRGPEGWLDPRTFGETTRICKPAVFPLSTSSHPPFSPPSPPISPFAPPTQFLQSCSLQLLHISLPHPLTSPHSFFSCPTSSTLPPRPSPLNNSPPGDGPLAPCEIFI